MQLGYALGCALSRRARGEEEHRLAITPVAMAKETQTMTQQKLYAAYTRHTIAFHRAVSLGRTCALLYPISFLLDRAHLDLDVVRPHKPLLVQIPLLCRILELDLIPSAHAWILACRNTYIVLSKHEAHHLIQLHQRQRSAQTRPIPASKRHIRVFHPLQSRVERVFALVLATEPPLRPVLFGIGTKDACVSVHNPWIRADDGARREHRAVSQRETCGGHNALEDVSNDRMDAQPFFDAGIQVRQLLEGLVGRWVSSVGASQFGN
jgi:hypothetical protein